MNILGIFGSIDWDAREPLDENKNHTYLHDAGATLFVDGKLSCSIQEERLTRYKFDGNFPYKSIEYCLSQANIKNFDIDIVYLSSAGNSLFNEKEKDKTLYKFIGEYFSKCDCNFSSIFYKKTNNPIPNQSSQKMKTFLKSNGVSAYGNYKNSSKWKEYFIDDSYHMPFVNFYFHDENDLISAEDNASVLQKNLNVLFGLFENT